MENFNFISKQIKQPRFQIYRLDKNGKRLYYRFNQNNTPVFYFSVTSFIKSTLPTSTHLIKWIAKNGYEESQEIMEEKADYGTFLHIQCQNILITGKYNFDETIKELKQYAKENLILESIALSWHDEIQKDILSFCQLIIDYKIKPLAIEMMLCSDTTGMAGAIDIVCKMTIKEKGFNGDLYKSGEKKGQPKESYSEREITAIIDIKSGRKGFYESHEIQLHCYKMLVEENYPELKIDKLYNFSPKEWRSCPTYNLKDQTESKSKDKINNLLEIYKVDFKYRDKNITLIEGELDLNLLSKNYKEISLDDYVLSFKKENL